MTKLLIRFFIKNSEDYGDATVRTAYSLMASIVGICCNLLLFVAKLSVGLLANSISIMADGFNNLSDAAASIIGYVGMKMAEKPADKEHPFGHGRVEYITAFVVAFVVIQVGFSLFKTSVQKMLHPEQMVFSIASVAILILSVGIKLWMALFNRTVGKKINSSVLIAASADSLGDVLATAATIISIVVFGIWGVNADGLIGLIVSVLVMVAGVNIAKDTLAPLIGEPIDPVLYRRISELVESYDGVVGSHDLIVHNYGPSKSMASIHAEVPNDVNMEISHEVIDRIERDVFRELGVFLVIHMDPVETKDEHVTALFLMVKGIIAELDSRLSIHDFRVVRTSRENHLIFDLVIPREYTEDMKETLKMRIENEVRHREEKCSCNMTMEYSFGVEE